MVLGHSALQESRSLQGEGWIQHLEGRSVRSAAEKAWLVPPASAPSPNHTVGFSGRLKLSALGSWLRVMGFSKYHETS